MAIDLPPLPPPQLASVAALQPGSDAAFDLRVAGYDARVSGATLVGNDVIARVLTTASDLSQAVRALSALYRLKGYIAVQVLDGARC